MANKLTDTPTLAYIGGDSFYDPHVFGKESSVEDITRRIAWEWAAEAAARCNGAVDMAEAHAKTRKAYNKLLQVRLRLS